MNNEQYLWRRIWVALAEIRHDLMAEVQAFAEQCPVGGGVRSGLKGMVPSLQK